MYYRDKFGRPVAQIQYSRKCATLVEMSANQNNKFYYLM